MCSVDQGWGNAEDILDQLQVSKRGHRKRVVYRMPHTLSALVKQGDTTCVVFIILASMFCLRTQILALALALNPTPYLCCRLLRQRRCAR